MKISVRLGLLFALCFQVSILIGMYVLAQIPLWTGNEIKLQTLPIDPRSMFRGNYTRLRYDISDIKRSYFPNIDQLRVGEIVYVNLKPNDKGYYHLDAVSLTLPKDTVFIQGRVVRKNYNDTIKIKYGIEAFFMPKEKALALEKELSSGGIAVLKVDKKGKARLENVIANR